MKNDMKVPHRGVEGKENVCCNCDVESLSGQCGDIILPAPSIITPSSVSKSTYLYDVDAAPSKFFPVTPGKKHVEIDDLNVARNDAKESAEALECLLDGIRTVKQILCATTSQNSSLPTECIRGLYQLPESLHGVLGSDLLALMNAADMAREHTRLAIQETSDVVADLAKAKAEIESLSQNAKQVKKVGRSLWRENIALKTKVATLNEEKRLLMKKIKSLRVKAAERQECKSRYMEQHVLNALTVHEQLLKTPSSVTSHKHFFDYGGGGGGGVSTPKGEHESPHTNGIFKESENTSSTSSTCPTPSNGTQNHSMHVMGFSRGLNIFRRSPKSSVEQDLSKPDSECPQNPPGEKDGSNDGLLRGFGTPTRHSSKNGVPSFDEASTVTEDSLSSMGKSRRSMEIVRVDVSDGAAASSDGIRRIPWSKPSPIQTEEATSAPEHMIFCDQNLPRSRAVLSPRSNESTNDIDGASLFEC